MHLYLTSLKRSTHFQMAKHGRAALVLCLVLATAKQKHFFPYGRSHNCLACSVATTKHCLRVGELYILLYLTTLMSCFLAILCKGHTLWPLLLSGHVSPIPRIHKPSSGAAAGSPRTHHQAYLWDVQQGKRVGRDSPGAVGATFRAGMQNWRVAPPPAGKGSRRSKCWRRSAGPGCEWLKSVATGCLLTYSSALKTR